MIKIPFNRPSTQGREIQYIRDAIRRGHLSGDGYYTHRCHERLEHLLGVPDVLLTPSCTHALEMAFLLADLHPGDEVILPTFTFTSTANAFILRGAIPRFLDSRSDTLNMNDRLLESALTPRTRAILPVHYGGVPCQMDVIMRFARKHQLYVIEDSAQALGATFKGKPAGTFGHLNAISFHETKNCMCGEGGALVIRDREFMARAHILRQKGTNRDQFLKGRVDKYSWVDIGSSYVPSELQSAYLLAQLEHVDRIHRRRKRLFEEYVKDLNPFEKRGQIQLPIIPSGCISSYHLFYVIFESEKERERVRRGLLSKGILAVTHYFPLHLSKMGRRYGYRQGQFPVAEQTSERLLRLPFYNNMTSKEQEKVLSSLKALL